MRELMHDLAAADSWGGFVSEFRGPSYLSPELEQVDHPVVPVLLEWGDHGVPALTSSDLWSLETLDSFVDRGCHRSAEDHAEFLRQEMTEFVENRFWTILTYQAVRSLANLQLSPSAVMEERERKLRLLCNHS